MKMLEGMSRGSFRGNVVRMGNGIYCASGDDASTGRWVWWPRTWGR
jgi:hypothetical protein